MNAKAQQLNTNIFLLLGIFFTLSACSGDGSSGPDCRYDAAWARGECDIDFDFDFEEALFRPGGIWHANNATGRPVDLYVTESGQLRFVDGFGSQGVGQFFSAVGDPDDANNANFSVFADFTMVTQPGATFADDTTLADCSFMGTTVRRQSMTLTLTCETATGLRFQEEFEFSFDTIYDRIPSLQAISGTYESADGLVLSIAANGTGFMQDPTSECVTNTQAFFLDPSRNIYRFEINVNNCIGDDAVLNGADFAGYAILDNTFSPELLTVVATGEIDGVMVSLLADFDRL